MPSLIADNAKEFLKRSICYDLYYRLRCVRVNRQWLRKGKPVPAPHPVKQRIVKEYAARYGSRTFVETGTYKGDMVYAVRRAFDWIY